DKAAGERLLRDSDLDWTIVYATRLTNGAATGKPRVLPDDVRIGLAASVSRADVADVLVRAVDDRAPSRREIVVAG
ncbi:MAG TPA: NAD(P)H-binding protein, partial [Motilibacteraceae bacterium]|nr:NAD(P)H-binding protein [Motilibacteraceae bacterium]